MNDFYKKLKSLREEKGIDLDKIHKRTKISLSALHAIEKGHFDQLQDRSDIKRHLQYGS